MTAQPSTSPAANTPFEVPADKKERRRFLIEISKFVQPYVEAGTYAKINDAILDYYQKRTGASVFHTLKAWRKQGCRVNKGAIGLPVWGHQRTPQKKKSADDSGDGKEARPFFPMAFLFSEKQVSKVATQPQA